MNFSSDLTVWVLEGPCSSTLPGTQRGTQARTRKPHPWWSQARRSITAAWRASSTWPAATRPRRRSPDTWPRQSTWASRTSWHFGEVREGGHLLNVRINRESCVPFCFQCMLQSVQRETVAVVWTVWSRNRLLKARCRYWLWDFIPGHKSNVFL